MFIELPFLKHPAPSGAECRLNHKTHIALRWSVQIFSPALSINIVLLPEHFHEEMRYSISARPNPEHSREETQESTSDRRSPLAPLKNSLIDSRLGRL